MKLTSACFQISSTTTMPPSKLFVLPLPHPLILLPAARITIPLSRTIGEHILFLAGELDNDSQLVLAAVPITTPTDSQTKSNGPVFSEWATAARLVRLLRPPPRNPKQPYLLSLQGITRLRLKAPLKLSITTDSLTEHPVEYPSTDTVPSRESVEVFKSAALRLLDRLMKNATVQSSRTDAWLKLSGMVEEISEARAAWMADVLVMAINGEYADKLGTCSPLLSASYLHASDGTAFLSAADNEERLKLATELFIKQASISEVSKKIAASVDESLSKQQKEFFLRQQLAAIQRELASLGRSPNFPNNVTTGRNNGVASPLDGPKSELDDDEQAEIDDMAGLKAKIEAMESGSEERKTGVREWRRLKRIPAGSVETGVIRSYLEWLTSIPWPSLTTAIAPAGSALHDRKFLTNAREQLDRDHFGLERIKRRLIEYLAVVRLKEINAEKEREVDELALVKREQKADNLALVKPISSPSATPAPTPLVKKKVVRVKGPILLFVGPPGTGKTSLGQSVAKALDRPFQRISLGGVRDEAEIRGHRRTYVASGPGMIVQALKKAGRLDPVILLDEIDKVGQGNFHGDPAAALLEVLDPEQNWAFNVGRCCVGHLDTMLTILRFRIIM